MNCLASIFLLTHRRLPLNVGCQYRLSRLDCDLSTLNELTVGDFVIGAPFYFAIFDRAIASEANLPFLSREFKVIEDGLTVALKYTVRTRDMRKDVSGIYRIQCESVDGSIDRNCHCRVPFSILACGYRYRRPSWRIIIPQFMPSERTLNGSVYSIVAHPLVHVSHLHVRILCLRCPQRRIGDLLVKSRAHFLARVFAQLVCDVMAYLIADVRPDESHSVFRRHGRLYVHVLFEKMTILHNRILLLIRLEQSRRLQRRSTCNQFVFCRHCRQLLCHGDRRQCFLTRCSVRSLTQCSGRRSYDTDRRVGTIRCDWRW